MSGFDSGRLQRLRDQMARHTEDGSVGGLTWLVARGDQVEAGAAGVLTRGEPPPRSRPRGCCRTSGPAPTAPSTDLGQPVPVTAPARDRLTFWQRMLLRDLRRRSRKDDSEPLSEEDWRALWEMAGTPSGRAVHWLWRTLPSSPRCGMCGAPFAGPGKWVVRPLGYRPSRKNPTLCSTCVETSPPGGMTMRTGVMFADLRGFTTRTESSSGAEMAKLLRRFYGCAERVLFPEAIIDKVVGDEVMALYLPDVQPAIPADLVADLMLDHAQELLRAVGYGSREGPFVEVGIGMDLGEAFVGNIGERAVYDFTAVGDVVNTAARLQGQARGGEVVLSRRVADELSTPAGTAVELELKGKAEPERAFRVPPP